MVVSQQRKSDENRHDSRHLRQAKTVSPVPHRYNFSVDNNEVNANDTLKILSVKLDRKLNFVADVSEQVKKGVPKPLRYEGFACLFLQT